MRTVVFIISLFVASAAHAQVIRYVSITNTTPVSPFTNGWASAATNIQDALNVCSDLNNTVLVGDGIYSNGWKTWAGDNSSDWNKSRIQITNHNVTLRSLNGPANTIIYGARNNEAVLDYAATNLYGINSISCVRITSRTNVVIDGFTLKNGSTATNPPFALSFQQMQYAPAVNNALYGQPSPRTVITNCVFTENYGGWQNSGGRGLFNMGVSSIVANCTFTSNRFFSAAGVVLGQGSQGTIVMNSYIAHNTNGHSIADASTRLVNSLIEYNHVTANNGYLAVVISNSIVRRNSSNGSAMLVNTATDSVLENNTNFAAIVGAPSAGEGFGINLIIRNNALPLVGDRALIKADLYNSVVHGNNYSGVPLFSSYSVSQEVRNVTFAFNVSANFCNLTNKVYLSNCLLFSNTVADVNRVYVSSVYTNSNFSAGVHFMNHLNQDYRLVLSSPAINFGNNAFVTTTNDLYGGSRIQGGIVDAGAYEYFDSPVVLPYGDPYPLFQAVESHFAARDTFDVGSLNIAAIPTNATGLVAGDVWWDGTNMRVVLP
jgi:hypothetical protein